MQFFAVCKAAAMSLTRHHDKSVSRCWWLDGLDQPHRLWLGQKKKSEIWTSVRKDRDKVWWRERDTKICQRCAWRDGQEVITGTCKEVRMSNSEMMETRDQSEEKGVAPPNPPAPPSAMQLCLSFQSFAQRIREAHVHASCSKHSAQRHPCRYRHALILTVRSYTESNEYAVFGCVRTQKETCARWHTQTHQSLSHLSWVVSPLR